MNNSNSSEEQRRETLRKLSICLLVVPVILTLLGYFTFDDSIIILWWGLGNVLFVFALILLYFYAVKPSITFWKLNTYFGIGLAVWAIPMMLVIRQIDQMISYIVLAALIVMGTSIAGFSFWAEKKGIEIS